jgi:ABC-type antimicrobial peptide transport system permease subunit
MFKNCDKIPLEERINYNITWKDGNPVYKTTVHGSSREDVSLEQIKLMYSFLGKKEQYSMYIKHNPNNKEKNDYYEYLIYKINKEEKQNLDEMMKLLNITINCPN